MDCITFSSGERCSIFTNHSGFYLTPALPTHTRVHTHTPNKEKGVCKRHILQAYMVQMCLNNSHFTQNDSFYHNSICEGFSLLALKS